LTSFTFAPSSPVSAGETVTFTGPETVRRAGHGEVAVTSWSWDFGDGSSAGIGRTPTHTFQLAGSFTVTMTIVRDEVGPVNLPDVTNTIDVDPVVSFSAVPSEGDFPLEVTITNASSGADTWSWDLGDGTTSTTETPASHTFDSAGSFTIALTASANGRSDDHSVTILVHDPDAGVEGEDSSSQTYGEGSSATTLPAGKYLKIETPDYYPSNSTNDYSYIRLGAIPDTASDTNSLEKEGENLKGEKRHGIYSYTTGYRLEATDLNREVLIGGSNRFTIGGGGLGVMDAEPAYGLWFRPVEDNGWEYMDDYEDKSDSQKKDIHWRKTEWGIQKSDTYYYGDSESFFGGFTFSGFAGLQTSMTLAGSLSTSFAIAMGINVGASIDYTAGINFSVKEGKDFDWTGGTKDIKAKSSVTVRTKSGTTADLARWVAAAGAAVALVGSTGTLISGLVQAHDDGTLGDPGSSYDHSRGWAIGTSAVAGAGVLAVAIALIAKAVINRFKKRDNDAWLRLVEDYIFLGNKDAEIAIQEKRIYLGAMDLKGAQFVVDVDAKKIYTQGAAFTTTLNQGTFEVLP
jgi:PKD repeat protein